MWWKTHLSRPVRSHYSTATCVQQPEQQPAVTPRGGGGGSVTSCVKGQHTGGEGVMSCLVSYYIGMTSNSIIIVILE